MLVGSWLINLALGVIEFTAVFISSFSNNLFQTSLIRGLFFFVSFFLLGYLIRVVLAQASKQVHDDDEREVEEHDLDNSGEIPPMESVEKEYSFDDLESFSENDIMKTTEYVRELMNDKED